MQHLDQSKAGDCLPGIRIAAAMAKKLLVGISTRRDVDHERWGQSPDVENGVLLRGRLDVQHTFFQSQYAGAPAGWFISVCKAP